METPNRKRSRPCQRCRIQTDMLNAKKEIRAEIAASRNQNVILARPPSNFDMSRGRREDLISHQTRNGSTQEMSPCFRGQCIDKAADELRYVDMNPKSDGPPGEQPSGKSKANIPRHDDDDRRLMDHSASLWSPQSTISAGPHDSGGGLRESQRDFDQDNTPVATETAANPQMTDRNPETSSTSIFQTHEHGSENVLEYGSNESADDGQHIVPGQRDKYRLGPLKGLPSGYSDASYTESLQEACLIRYFAEHLAPWFDTTDRDRHFGLVVPERAMFCPVLRYAIFTASAGHLTRLLVCRGEPQGTVIFDGIPLPNLNEDSAIYYHNICISYLIEISEDPHETYNEDVLTAATILRFYEQIDAPSSGNDSEAYLNAIQFIVNTQRNESFYAYHTIHGPSRDTHVHAVPAVSLRHSACLIALRQEIWSAFLHQRPFRFPVSPLNTYTTFDVTCDFVWANRILVWCADLLKFCFGNQYANPEERMARWTTLKAFEINWDSHKSPSFRPTHYEDPDPKSGRYFPIIWHMNAAQVIAAQHIELGRILLSVSNPRISRLGVGARTMNHALEEELRCITRKLCGLALSNPKCPVNLVDAAVGISVCGEYFIEPGEQEAIIQFLTDLEYQHGWPTQATVKALQTAWGVRSSSTDS